MRLFQRNGLLNKHGETGRLMLQIAAHARVGWWLFVVTAVACAGLVITQVLVPKPVLLVDRSGRIVGHVVWRVPQVSNRALLRDCMRFTSNFMSLNSATVFADYAHALNLMAPTLRHHVMKQLRRTHYLASVHLARSVSWIRFDKGAGKPRVVHRAARDALVHLAGNIIVIGKRHRRLLPFDLLLGVHMVTPETNNLAGIVITSVTQQ